MTDSKVTVETLKMTADILSRVVEADIDGDDVMLRAQGTCLRNLSDICNLRGEAIKARREGRTDDAMKLEKDADAAMFKLPKSWRW